MRGSDGWHFVVKQSLCVAANVWNYPTWRWVKTENVSVLYFFCVDCVLYFLLQHRRLLYELFTKNYRIRRNMIQVRVTQEFGDASKADIDRLLNVRWVMGLNLFKELLLSISDLTYHLLFQECCSSHAGMWYLKGTIQSWHWESAPCDHHQPIKSSSQVSSGMAVKTDERQSQLAQLWRRVIGEQRCQPPALFRTWRFSRFTWSIYPQ